MKIIIPMAVLRAHEKIRAKSDIRYYLNGIFFRGDEVWSTDGHIAMWSEDNYNFLEDLGDGVIVQFGPIPAAKSIQSCVVDTETRIAYFFQVGIESREALDEVDMSSRFRVTDISIVDGRFPDINRVKAQAKVEAVENIGFSTRLLARTLDVSKALEQRFECATFTFHGKTSGAGVEIKSPNHTMNLIIMPMRID
ncbi:MAG: hypothetical protein [Bacteriophage sp.]|nr:MAG: hypothetical protein [Bacteriophage sp.]